MKALRRSLHTASTAAGSATNPVYVNASGVATPCTYDLNKTVPADAVFTDTVYTHPTDGANTGSFGPSTDATATHGGTISVPYITVNSDGHVTAASTKTITLPSDSDTQVTNTLGTTTKFYLTGTTFDTTNTGTQYFDTGIYSTTTAGQLYVTSLALPSGIIIS